MFFIVLILHIIIAVGMACSAGFTLLGVWKNDGSAIGKYSRLLLWGLGLELASGSLLALLSPESTSILHFCRNIAVYLVFTGSIIFAAFLHVERRYPSPASFLPVLPGLFMSAYAVLGLW